MASNSALPTKEAVLRMVDELWDLLVATNRKGSTDLIQSILTAPSRSDQFTHAHMEFILKQVLDRIRTESSSAHTIRLYKKLKLVVARLPQFAKEYITLHNLIGAVYRQTEDYQQALRHLEYAIELSD